MIMSNNYRRLNSKDRKKLEMYKASKKVLKKGIKWWLVISCIVCLFVVGLAAFYITIDNIEDKNLGKGKERLSFVNSKSINEEDDTVGLSELNKKELERESDKEKIISDSEGVVDSGTESGFYDFKAWNDSCSPELVVINAGNRLPENVNIKIKVCRGKEVGAILSSDLERMICDAKKEGIILWISSGYRSVDLQTRLFKRQIEREKSKEIINEEEAEKRAARIVARPYTSEHNTGLAIDFNGVEDNFYTTKEYKWLINNAHKYGFIERYQKKWQSRTGVIYEPWHFRYVGKEVAPLIRDSGLCLEDYVKKNLVNKNREEH